MRRPATILLLLSGLFALPASAAELPFAGRWGYDPAVCATSPGESDLIPTIIANGEIQYYESQCRVETIEPIGGENGSAWRVRMACAGEGETWTTNAIFAIDTGYDQRRRQLVEIDLDTGFVTVQQACD